VNYGRDAENAELVSALSAGIGFISVISDVQDRKTTNYNS